MATGEKQTVPPQGNIHGKALIVELLRFIFSLIIVSWHYLWHNYGIRMGTYIVVEYFLIMSGFLMYRQMGRYGFTYENAWKLTWKRATSMWPVYIVGCVSVVISQSVFRDGLDIVGVAREMLYAIPEFFYLRFTNNNALWYIQKMLIAGLIMMLLLAANKKAFVYGIAPLSVWFIYWSLFERWNGIQNLDHYTFTPLIQDNLFRAFAGLSLGAAACALYEHLEEHKSSIATKLMYRRGNVLACAGIAFGAIIMELKQCGLFELICVAMFFFAVIGLFGGRDFDRILAPFSKQIRYLGTLSFSLYVNHYAFDWIHFPFHPAVSLALIFVINLIYAAVTYWAVTKFCAFFKRKTAAFLQKCCL